MQTKIDRLPESWASTATSQESGLANGMRSLFTRGVVPLIAGSSCQRLSLS
jgi:hypothetical protein